MKSCLAPPTSAGWISPQILKTQEDWCKNKKLQVFSLPYGYMIKLRHSNETDWLSGYWAAKWWYLRPGAGQELQDPKENAAATSDLCAVCAPQNNKFHGYQVNSSKQTIQSFKTMPLVYCQHTTAKGNLTSCTDRLQARQLNHSPWLQHNMREFHLADETRIWFGVPGQLVSFTHLSLSLLSRGGLAASQLSYLEGRQLTCYGAPNQRGATSCLQGAAWFKFPD